MKRQLFAVLAVGTAAACRPDIASDSDPPLLSASDTTVRSPAPLAPGVSVEVLLAGRPPQRTLSYHPRVDPEDEHRPIFIKTTHYGPPDGQRTEIMQGTLGVQTRTTETDDVVERTFSFSEDGKPRDEVALLLGALGPSDVAGNYSQSVSIDTVLDALVVPLPSGPVGEGALWRVDRPIGPHGDHDDDIPAGAVLRTTVELSETFSDGFVLKLETKLHIPGSEPEPEPEPTPPPGSEPEPAPAETREARTPSGERSVLVTAQVWQHFDRILPTRAYGMLRQTRYAKALAYTDIIEWSLDLTSPSESP